MPLEIAFIPVNGAHADRFAQAATVALTDIFPQAPGFIRGECRRGVERPDTFVLLLEWERLEDHTEGFVKSELFIRWVELTDGLIAGAPVVEHWESTSGRGSAEKALA
ncbi:antibiotic biosynthesis monooxygenase [Microcella alkalica]|uniref:Heme-degrading monooxygenase HmoA n=1 Tax=Microcella alkalica TaxID=355930 RepID=A0A839EDB5_9MICO|nr:heme-degrading monooxygenase HmoA [Microcella alkalica]